MKRHESAATTITLLIGLFLFVMYFPFVAGFSNRKSDLYENMVNASVLVYNEYGSGSGVFIDDNVVLTAAHVLENADTFTIELSDGTILESSDFYIDDKEDIGFVFVDADELHIAKVSPSPRSIGNVVYLVGAPFNKAFKFTMTKGILSHLDRDLPDMGWEDLLQTDAEGGPGSSGSPLYDSEGNVIGMYVGYAIGGSRSVGLCESAKSILEAYDRCKDFSLKALTEVGLKRGSNSATYGIRGLE